MSEKKYIQILLEIWSAH